MPIYTITIRRSTKKTIVRVTCTGRERVTAETLEAGIEALRGQALAADPRRIIGDALGARTAR